MNRVANGPISELQTAPERRTSSASSASPRTNLAKEMRPQSPPPPKPAVRNEPSPPTTTMVLGCAPKPQTAGPSRPRSWAKDHSDSKYDDATPGMTFLRKERLDRALAGNDAPRPSLYAGGETLQAAPMLKMCTVPLSEAEARNLDSGQKASEKMTARSTPRRSSFCKAPVCVEKMRSSVPLSDAVAKSDPSAERASIATSLSCAVMTVDLRRSYSSRRTWPFERPGRARTLFAACAQSATRPLGLACVLI
mmetsp:Transcript_31817/g.109432  ORF Transcript_31817/g.109432 Transcript_31817/m.109432 type:complete len:251 (-) Transcript_31817:468-1220(-)